MIAERLNGVVKCVGETALSMSHAHACGGYGLWKSTFRHFATFENREYGHKLYLKWIINQFQTTNVYVLLLLFISTSFRSFHGSLLSKLTDVPMPNADTVTTTVKHFSNFAEIFRVSQKNGH